MAPSRVRTTGQTPAARRNLRAAKGAEEEAEHLCQVCFRSFSSAQALGGHKNAHRREREETRNHPTAQGTRWVAVSPPPPLMRSCVYVVGQSEFLYQQPPSGGLAPVPPASVLVLESSSVEGPVTLPGTSPSPLLFPSSTSSKAAESTADGVPHRCCGADEEEEGHLEDIDLTLHL